MNDATPDAVLTASLPAGASPQLKAALKTFLDDFQQHSRKNGELIEVLIQALKTVNQELQQQKLKNHLQESRLKRVETHLAELDAIVSAFRRQGWLQ